jgi:Flp pilus assembly protein TadD
MSALWTLLSPLVLGCLVWTSLPLLPSDVWAAEQAEVEYAKGILAYDNRNYLDALAHFRTVVALQPEDVDAQFYLGLTLSRLGEYEEAAAALEQVLRLDTSKRYVHHHLGLAYFLQERYEDALVQLELAAQFDPQKAATQFYLGNTHYQLQQYEQALPPLQQALVLDPDLALSGQYYQGLTLFALERDQEARKAFRAAATAAPESSIARNAQRYLEAITRRARERRLVQVQAAVGYQFDDNVILEPNGNAFDISGEADGRMVFLLHGRLLPLRTPRWRLGAEYTLYQSKHFRLHDFDIQSHTAGLFTNVRLNRVTLDFAANYNITYLDSTLFVNYDRFSEAVTVEARATIRQTEALFAVLSAQYRHSNFFEISPENADPDVRDRDGWSVRPGFDQYVLFNQRQSYVRLSYHYEGSRNEGSDWEFDGHEVGVGLHQPLWAGLALDAAWRYTRRDYLHLNSFDAGVRGELEPGVDSRERQDDRFFGSLALSLPVGQYLALSFGVEIIRNLSNIDFFEYSRNIWSFTLSGRW